VIRVVGFAYSVSVEEFRAGGRTKTMAECRMVAYWMLRSTTKLSTKELGRAVGRDHTSVIVGSTRCEQRRQEDPGFAAFTDELRVAVEARIANGRKLG
jgi:chromosomal replication initiation ATPase DnaA